MHFENIGPGFHVELPNHKGPPRMPSNREYLAPRKITKADMTKWISQANLDEGTKAGLTKMLAEYPANTMHHFFKNIHAHIARIQAAQQEQKKDEE